MGNKKNKKTEKNDSASHMPKFALVMLAIAIAFAGAFSTVEVKAQCPSPPPDCPGQPFINGGMVEIIQGTCTTRYYYCYRFACNMYYDAYIYRIELRGNCDIPFPFDKKHYDSLVDACMADLVGRVNPWGVPPASIPNCPAQSRTYWRMGKPDCTSDWYSKWIDGNLWMVTTSCNIGNLHHMCWVTYTYCWEFVAGQGRKLVPRKTSSGAPSSFVCPDFKPDDYQGTVKCNRSCD